MSDLNSPMLEFQWQRLLRLGFVFWGIVLSVWVFLSWFLRRWMLDELYLSNALGAATDLLVTPLLFMLRIDLPLAILLQSYLWPRGEWLQMGPQLRLTMLTAHQMAASRVLPTVIVLCVLNTLSAPVFYEDVMSMYAGVGVWYEFHLGVFMAIGAWLEDLAFAAICVLCAALYLGDPTRTRQNAIASAVGAVLLRGAAVALVAGLHFVIQSLLFIVPMAFGIMIEFEWILPLITIPSVIVLLCFETWLIKRLWRRLCVECRIWWEEEPPTPIR